MAKPSQHSQGDSAGSAMHGGGVQAVVELCDVNEHGLVFWARQRFEVGAELQVRLCVKALPKGMWSKFANGSGWVNVRGFVVLSEPLRRPNGAYGFRVSLLLGADQGDHSAINRTPLHGSAEAFFRHRWLGGHWQGWN